MVHDHPNFRDWDGIGSRNVVLIQLNGENDDELQGIC